MEEQKQVTINWGHLYDFCASQYKDKRDSVKTFCAIRERFNKIKERQFRESFNFINLLVFIQYYQEYFFEDEKVIDIIKNIKESIDDETIDVIIALKDFAYEKIDSYDGISDYLRSYYRHNRKLVFMTLILIFGEIFQSDQECFIASVPRMSEFFEQNTFIVENKHIFGIVKYSIILSEYSLLKKIMDDNSPTIRSESKILDVLEKNWQGISGSGIFTCEELERFDKTFQF